MKLTKIKIVNFGQFSDYTFDLPNSNINVFFGANEAGKSTVVAFIKQVIFGFHLGSTKTDFFEDYQPLARVSPMGGSLFFENDSGDCFELERLYASGKGSKLGTLTVKLNEKIVPESIFFDQIKNIDGDFYADSFIFNQDMLAKVGKIGQTDLLERIYYLGAANSDQLINLRDDFAKKASDLFKKGGSNPPINRLLKQMKEQKIKVGETENEFSDYQELNSQLKEQEKILARQQEELFALEKKLEKFENLQKLLPNYQKLEELKKRVEPVNFHQGQYEAAQTLALKSENLQKNVMDLQKRLANFSESEVDYSASAKLVQKKPEILQWQSEYRSCSQKIKQINSEEEQLAALNPDLAKVSGLTQDAIVKLQNDYQELPRENIKPSEPANTAKFLVMGSAGLIIVGAILLIFSSIAGGICIALGVVLMLLSLNKRNKEKRAQETKRAEDQERAQKKADFTKKYGLNPDQLDLRSLVNEWRQYQFQEQNKSDNHSREAEIMAQVELFAQNISQFLNQPVSADFESVLTALDQIEGQLTKSRRQADEKANFQNSLASNKEELHENNLRLKAILAQAQVKDIAEYKALQAKKQEQDAIKTKIEVLNANLEQDLPQLKQVLQKESFVQVQEGQLKREIEQKRTNIKDLQAKVAEFGVKMTNLSNSTAVFAAKQELANVQTQFKNLSAEYLANLAASNWIARALDLASNERFPKMLVAAKEYLRLLTNNRYNNIEIDKKVTVTRSDGKKIKVQYLSRGTSEQLYFALKLAFVQQIRDKINLPILIDDSFVNFDDQRIDHIKELLERIAQNNEVLIFTAQSSIVAKLQLQPLTFTKGIDNV